jgi:leucyl-tRNA synthetase
MPAARETDTLDTSSIRWYFIRSPASQDKPFDIGGRGSWLPWASISGVEHAILHLLYARFWTRA